MKEFLDPALITAENEPTSWAEVNAEHAIPEKKRLGLSFDKKPVEQGKTPTSWQEVKEMNARRKFKKAA
jgi:hypothetical protein